MARRQLAASVVLCALLAVLVRQSAQQLPMAMAAQLDAVTTPAQFMKLVTNGAIKDSDGTFVIERKGVQIAEPAGCKPFPEVVPLRGAAAGPGLHYYPSCTRIERCSGCCNNPQLVSCQPVSVELLHFSIIVTKYQGGNKLTRIGNETVTIEKHLKCKCDCIIKASDCNRYQVYNKGSCQCVCVNKDEQRKCAEDTSGKKIWNPITCTCDCAVTAECSTGYRMNKYTCSCEPEQRPRIRWGGIYDVDSKVSSKRSEYRT